MDVTKPCELIGFGAMDVTKPYGFIGFGAMDVTKPYELLTCNHSSILNLRFFPKPGNGYGMIL